MLQRESRNIISYYFRIWVFNLKASLKRTHMYKSEIFIRLTRTLFILATQVVLITLIFGNEKVYAGWTKDQAYLVMGIWNLLNYSGWALFGINLEQLERDVLDGSFDYSLLKPLSSAWYASFHDFSIYNWISSLSGFVLIGYYLFRNINVLTWSNILLGCLGILIGFIIWYSMYLLLASFAFVNPRNGFMALAKEILALTKYPIDIFGSSIQFVFYTLLPIAFVSSVPANMIIGRGNIYVLIFGVIVDFFFLRFALWVWYRNLKKYTSAGG